MRELWLKPSGSGEKKKLQLWNGTQHREIPMPDCSAVPIAELLEEKQTQAVATPFPPELVEALDELFTDSEIGTLHLDSQLPTEWIELPWEQLQFQGAPLSGRVLIERHRTLTTLADLEPIPPVKAEGCLLDLFPWPEIPAADQQNHPSAWSDEMGAPLTIQSDLDYMERQALDRFGALIVLSHGSELEGEADPPLRLKEGTLRHLPEVALPPLLILLACGSSSGSLVRYGQQRLQQRPELKSIIVAHGQLNVSAALTLLKKLWQRWQQGITLGEALVALQKPDLRQSGGGERLRLLGRSDLRCQSVSTVLPPSRLPSRAELERWTLAQALNLSDPKHKIEPDSKLLKQLVKEPHPKHAELEQFVGQLDSLTLPTRCWLIPVLSYYCERYAHPFLDRLRRFDLRRHCPNSPAASFYRMAKSYYRNGDYHRALDLAVEAQQSDPKLPSPLRLTAGILTDLLLPDAAEHRLEQAQDRAHQQAVEESEAERFKALDIQARLAIRQRDWRRAKVWSEKKRQIALSNQEDGLRELSWLLYLGVMAEFPQADDGAAELAEKILFQENAPSWADQLAQRGQGGNANLLYALRAYCFWLWIRGNHTSRLAQVEHWFQELLAQSPPRDPAPVGFVLAFLLLASTQQGAAPIETLQELWEEWQVKMEGEHYHAELMALHLVLGEFEAAQDQLRRFWKHRQQSLQPLLKESDPELEQELAASTRREEAIWAQCAAQESSRVRWRLLVEEGIWAM